MTVAIPYHDNFLNDPILYDAIQAMWQDLINELSLKYGFSYQPYINPYFSNGEKDRGGNPVFNTLIVQKNRGIRIIQAPAEDPQELYISAYLDTFEWKEEKELIKELVIDLVLSDISKKIAEEWVYAWLVQDIDERHMEALIEQKMILQKE